MNIIQKTRKLPKSFQAPKCTTYQDLHLKTHPTISDVNYLVNNSPPRNETELWIITNIIQKLIDDTKDIDTLRYLRERIYEIESVFGYISLDLNSSKKAKRLKK